MNSINNVNGISTGRTRDKKGMESFRRPDIDRGVGPMK